jgi:hypothetical protein
MADHALEPIRNRVIERRRMRAAELRPHPQNARRHPDTQARSLEAVVREVGQVGELYAYRSEKLGGALTLLDGHLRLERFPDSEWDIAITDLTDAEAALMLASRDRVTELATWDSASLDELLESVHTDEEAIEEMLSQLMIEADAGQDANVPVAHKPRQASDMDLLPYEHYDYIVVLSRNLNDYQWLCSELGITIVKSPLAKTKIGIGRAVWAGRLIERLKHGRVGDHHAEPGAPAERSADAEPDSIDDLLRSIE